jgi:hypothetical protein
LVLFVSSRSRENQDIVSKNKKKILAKSRDGRMSISIQVSR